MGSGVGEGEKKVNLIEEIKIRIECIGLVIGIVLYAWVLGDILPVGIKDMKWDIAVFDVLFNGCELLEKVKQE